MNIFPIQPEYILYIFIVSCIAVLIYNIVFLFVRLYFTSHINKRVPPVQKAIVQQIELLTSQKTIELAYFESLEKKLNSRRELKIFELALAKTQEQVPEDSFRSFVMYLRVLFLKLATVYKKRDEIEQAYFAYVVYRFSINQGQTYYDSLMETLVEMVVGKSVYQRENALKALYSIGNIDAVIAAWTNMQDNNIYHSSKLLTDGLLQFAGNKRELIHRFLDLHSLFDERLMLPALRFMRYYSEDLKEEMYSILKDRYYGKELRIESIRYFRNYHFEKVKPLLLEFVRNYDDADWEYAAVASIALTTYPSAETIETLKLGLKAKNWYVRYNCAVALVTELNVPKLDLFDVINGTDRYAREVISYVYERTSLLLSSVEKYEE